MAEALCRRHYGRKLEAQSAGVAPWPDLHPMARKVMAERGEALAGHYPKDVRTFSDSRFDLVVTIGDRALAECPELPGNPERIHWELSDPANADGQEDLEEVFRTTLAAIERHLASLIQSLAP